MLNLILLARYVKKLSANAKAAGFLSPHYARLFEKMEAVAQTEPLD